MAKQLRMYKIEPSLERAFLDRFRNHAAPIMKQRYGFTILDKWFSRSDEELWFVYLIDSPTDAAVLLEKMSEFVSDEEWVAIKKQTREQYGEMVLGKVEKILEDIE